MIPVHAGKALASFGALNPAIKEKLKLYVSLLQQWNQRINLIGKSTEEEIWERHILDSARLLPFIPEKARILTDFGSGAGFPGLVLAIMKPELETHLIESDRRKAVFLQEAFRVTETRGIVHAERIEKAIPWLSDVITARALAPLNRLIEYAQPFRGTECLCLFAKGCKAMNEIEEAKKSWEMDYALYPGAPEAGGFIVVIKGVVRHA